MDIPVWHPANVGTSSSEPKGTEPRTEFLVMPGSGIDPSIGGEELIDELQGSSVPQFADPRGLYDTSDRLYLKEQTYARKVKEAAQRQEEQEALSMFYAAAAAARSQPSPPLIAPGTLAPAGEESEKKRSFEVAVKVKKSAKVQKPTVSSKAKKKKEKQKTEGIAKAKVSSALGSLVSYSDEGDSNDENPES